MTATPADPALKAAAPATRARGPIADRITFPLALAAVAASSLVRFVIAGRQPLWLDETWTGAIAAQTRFSDVWRQIYWDVNAPLYYLCAHLWAQVAGLSDAALRFPSAVFGAAAAITVAAWPVEGLPRNARLTWAAILGCWIPGVWFSGDARCYALLFALCTAQTLAFARLLQAPDLRRAALWAGVAALAILTHYHALLLAGLQGAIYLARGRGRALRTWPAALLFLPVFAWLWVHAPRIAEFARPEVAWYPRLTWTALPREALQFLVGSSAITAEALAAVAAVGVVTGFALRDRKGGEPWPLNATLWLAVGASVVGAAAVIGIGFLRPSFVDRYLTPFIPGFLLGIAMIAQALARRWALTYVAVILCFVGPAAPWAWRQARHGWRWYNFEVASEVLMKGNPQRLVFFWDHPAAPIEAPGQLDAVGEFSFRRAGHPVEVSSVVLKPGEEPNARLVAEAKLPRSAILWMYDLGVQGTAARAHRPNIAALDPSLSCRNLGSGSVGILACDRAMGAPRP